MVELWPQDLSGSLLGIRTQASLQAAWTLRHWSSSNPPPVELLPRLRSPAVQACRASWRLRLREGLLPVGHRLRGAWVLPTRGRNTFVGTNFTCLRRDSRRAEDRPQSSWAWSALLSEACGETTETVVCPILRPGRPASWRPEFVLRNRQCFWKHRELGPLFVGDAPSSPARLGAFCPLDLQKPVPGVQEPGQVSAPGRPAGQGASHACVAMLRPRRRADWQMEVVCLL